MSKQPVKIKKEQQKDIAKGKTQSLSSIYIKLATLLLIVLLAIIISDRKGYFNPDLTNNHTIKKWDAFYYFTKRNNIDVLLLGNSHLYTGINPKNLSVRLGANSFILASPGTYIGDTYFCLKEALKRCEPSVVIIETYGINNSDPYEFVGGSLSDQFKSFSARRDKWVKIKSTPYLFNVRNYLYAWSNTLRNHDYIFNNKEQIQKNKSISLNKEKKKKKLYLGRYARFNSGLKDSLLLKYETEGAPVDGAKYKYSKQSKYYVDKIIELCNKNNIELVFLTLPMYNKHVSNYDKWEEELSNILDKSKVKWLNMQNKNTYTAIGFDAFAFENTYSSNQHMTYNGSLLATYELANYLSNNKEIEIPNRKKDYKWHKLFYGEEGYFHNFSASKNDEANKTLCENKKIRNATVKEILLVKNKNKSKTVIAKIKKPEFNNYSLKNTKLSLLIKFLDNKVEKHTIVNLRYDMFHSPLNYIIYSHTIKPIEIIDVIDGAVVSD